jgi:hypothetical protein
MKAHGIKSVRYSAAVGSIRTHRLSSSVMFKSVSGMLPDSWFFDSELRGKGNSAKVRANPRRVGGVTHRACRLVRLAAMLDGMVPLRLLERSELQASTM